VLQNAAPTNGLRYQSPFGIEGFRTCLIWS
jgi:hypothetical protein